MNNDKPSPEHIRLPERADAVSGREAIPGEISKPASKPDPRTASQDPTIKSD
jgi:hypothetical protein